MANEIPEESDQFRFLRVTCYVNIKGSVGLILVKVSTMRISIPLDLSSRVCTTRPINECRCDERLKSKTEESTRLTYTVLFGELEHLQIKRRLIDEKVGVEVKKFVYLNQENERQKDKTYI